MKTFIRRKIFHFLRKLNHDFYYLPLVLTTHDLLLLYIIFYAFSLYFQILPFSFHFPPVSIVGAADYINRPSTKNTDTTFVRVDSDIQHVHKFMVRTCLNILTGNDFLVPWGGEGLPRCEPYGTYLTNQP
jgi:hypothetical protein